MGEFPDEYGYCPEDSSPLSPVLVRPVEPSTPPLDQVRAVLTERMRQERAKANSQAYIAALLQQNPVSINEVTLAKALAK